MGLLYTLLSFFLVMASPPSDSVLLDQSRKQAEYYISQIQNERNSDLHLWALAQLCGSNPEISAFIDELSENEMDYNLPLQPFCGGQEYGDLIQDLAFITQSPDLLIAAVLEKQSVSSQQELLRRYSSQVGFPGTTTIPYRKLLNRIINQGAIDGDILPFESFNFIHFLLIYNSELYTNEVLPHGYLREASSYWLSSGSPFQKLTLTNSLYNATLFRALYLIDEYAKTENLYFVLTQDKLFPISNLLMTIQRTLDLAMYRLGYYDRSLDISRTHSVPLARFFDDKQKELSSLILQGVYLIRIGKMKDAQEINLYVLEQSRLHDVDIPQSSLFTNLGITYLNSGEFDKYLDLQFQALQEADKLKNYSHLLSIFNNLYNYYRQNNDSNTALLYLEEASKLAQDYGNQDDLGAIYTYVGTFYKKFQQDYSRSLDYFKKAEAILDSENHFNNYLNLLYEKGKLFEETGNYDQAISNYSNVIDLSRDKSIKHLFEALVNKAAVHLKLNELGTAFQHIEEINTYDFSQFDFRHIIKAKSVHANYLVKNGQHNDAYTILKPVIQQTVEWARNSTDLQSGFWNVEQEFLDAFQLTADLLIETKRTEEAVEVLDKLKSINDATLYQNPMVRSSHLTELELAQYQRFTNQLDELRKQLFSVNEKKQLEIQTRIDQLSARKRTLDRKITAWADTEPASVREVQNKLSGYEAVLHMTELNDWYYIATIFRNEVQYNKVRLDSSLRSVLTRSAQQLASGETNLNDLYQISELLDLQDLPSWINKITIIPDSYLYQFPVDILPLSRPESSYSYGSTTYFIERFTTHYLTSLNDFNIPETDRENYEWDFIGYGVSDFQSHSNSQNLVPLPYAETEVSTILSGLTNLSNKTVFLDSSSTEAVFKSTAPGARIMHLATHSRVSERDPLFSSIYLSQHGAIADNDFPGQIFAYELFELNLASDLIMLNSCESGSGSYLQGSGIMGISRALRYAGANSLILNLWLVNDMMASDFAIQFYSQLNEGKTKAEALRTAKLHMLKSNNANPHHWGTYMLIGKNDAVVNPHEKTNIYLASSFVLYFLVLVVITMFRKGKKGK